MSAPNPSTSSLDALTLKRTESTPWVQLALGMIAMLAISSPQYVWALFVQPMQASLGVSLSALQVTFALFSICQCGIGPLHGELAARVSSRTFVIMGGVLVGLSWVSSAYVTSLPMLYLTYGVLSGIGTGWVYVAVVELMVQWFPRRRGFAVGMVAGCYGLGAIVTTFPIAGSLRDSGLQDTLVMFGIVLAAIIVLAALGMKRLESPGRQYAGHGPVAPDTAATGYTPSQMLRTPLFWLMFAIMAMVATGGLMAISQLGALASHFGITNTTLVLGMAALPLALTLDRAANGLTRPFFGWVSDRIGREPTMLLAFLLEALSIFLLLKLGTHPVAFVVLSAVVFFGWGEIYSLFPSLQADVFGTRHAARNFGYLLIATAVGSVLGGPIAALLFEKTRSWDIVFHCIIALDVAAALLSILVLKPMRVRWMAAARRAGPPRT
ncbi:oxalate/formate MFS antiporter [Bordetella genomosp. 11]|uniref:Oxalate/formate MFS antiporter n=1 Tax=Bordetella genomosp. 11 TaxID=1416808 RepID=A0A261UGU2_9BORD|nr:oxalate/formate MFS antiporter [Bordetella genomosp. 11]OZI60632.1 oxalate/formate MFS antiporter [Bordetella genomosp. 11]